MSGALVEVGGLTLRRAADGVPLLEEAAIRLGRGDVLGIVGESGSGKSLLVSAIAGLLPAGVVAAGGEIVVGPHRLTGLDEAAMRPLRGRAVAMVFQDPFASLNPVRPAGAILVEAVRAHRPASRDEARRIAIEALRAVGIPEPERRIDAYPHELSGGQRQRVLIALAMLNDPMLLIADEPTTALDPTTRLGILDLLRAGADRRATIFVTHDLGSAARICTHLAVIYAGRIVESGPAAALLRAPLHPYTRALLDAFPRLGGAARPRPIPGQVIPPDARGAGCSFAPRCPRAMPACAAAPTLATHGDRLAACHAAGAAA